MKVNQQKSSEQLWKDETGMQIPYARVSGYERKAERVLSKVAKDAIRLNAALASYKDSFRQEAQELYELFLKENGGKVGKGNATFYNFDRSLKVEVSVHDQISFDENLINLAKQKLDEVLNEGLDGAKDFIKPLVMDAFNTSNGKLDTKRVLGLRRHASRIKNAHYDEAMALIDKAIRRPSTREYYRVWVRDDKGEYKSVDLNFSSI